MVDRVYYIILYTLYSYIYIFQLNQYVIAFNYADSRDNGKLLIGTFPNESDDGESRACINWFMRVLVIFMVRTCRNSIL